MANVHVGVTNADPRDQQRMPRGEFDLTECYFYEGPVPNGATVRLECPPGVTGRYLVVQLQDTNFLILCEVTAAAGWYQTVCKGCFAGNRQVIKFHIEIKILTKGFSQSGLIPHQLVIS